MKKKKIGNRCLIDDFDFKIDHSFVYSRVANTEYLLVFFRNNFSNLKYDMFYNLSYKTNIT